MNIRIGNDIRLNLTLKGPKNYDSTNIKSLKCYFINTSLCDFCNPCCGELKGCGCGRPCYHVEPCNMCHCHKPCGHLKYPYTPADPAFGQGPLRPNYGHCFHGCCCHKDFDNYCRYGFMDHRAKCHPHGCGFCHCCDKCAEFTPYFRPGHCDMIHTHFEENFRYLAASRILEGKNKIQTYFPAQDQLICGDYKLVVVLVVYEAGWGRCDLHTYTIDYGTVFTLVDDDSAINGDVTIDVDNDKLVNSDMTAINTFRNITNYYMYSNSNLMLGQKDNNGNKYQIEVELTNGSTLPYNPENWPYDELTFRSANTDILEVMQDGTLISHNPINDTEVVITVENKRDSRIKVQFTVTVLGTSADYIFFCNIRPAYDASATWGLNREDQGFEDGVTPPTNTQENPNTAYGTIGNYGLGDVYAYVMSQPQEVVPDQNAAQYRDYWQVQQIFGDHLMKSDVSGQYLWIMTRSQISSITCDGMNVPISYYGSYNNYFFYACPNPLQSNVIFNIQIKK